MVNETLNQKKEVALKSFIKIIIKPPSCVWGSAEMWMLSSGCLRRLSDTCRGHVHPPTELCRLLKEVWCTFCTNFQ